MLKHNLRLLTHYPTMTGKNLVLPDLGAGDQPIVLSMWLVKQGANVVAGEPAVEVMLGNVTVDLPAPADGVLTQKLVAEGDSLSVGQRLAVVETEN
jgi:pyruvate/2-oxoglutarate dehydrogenase complex dihydrolipoamide acyltransferase (E2) component